MAYDFKAVFADLLSPQNNGALAPLEAARVIARYHHFRQSHGKAHDSDMLAIMKEKGYLPASEADSSDLAALSRGERMMQELIRAALECLKDGRDLHSAMMCGLTACIARDDE